MTAKSSKIPKPVDPNTKINEPMKEYMESILKINKTNNEIKDELFTSTALKSVNQSIRNGNFYILDKYGLPIRKQFQDSKKSPFGWRYNEQQEPINIHIDSILLNTNSEDILKMTLRQLKSQFPTQFNPPRGIIYKIYTERADLIDLKTL